MIDHVVVHYHNNLSDSEGDGVFYVLMVVGGCSVYPSPIHRYVLSAHHGIGIYSSSSMGG